MTPDKNTHNNTHKNRAITAFFNRFALICFIASGAVLTACIGNESKESLYDFSARTFVLPSDLSIEASTGSGNESSNVALRYLTSINFDKYERQGTVFGTVIRGSDFDSSNDRLGAEDGFLIIETKGENGDGGHVFAGRFDTTDVGDELTATPPVATFSGQAVVVLVHSEGSGLFSGNTSLSRRVRFNDLELTVDFDAKSLKGTVTGSPTNGADSLTVDGRFSGERLSGSVRMNLADPAIVGVADRSAFTASLNGVIGEDGAVGVFNNHLARGKPSDYALGGGFVVKPPPATNP